MKDPHGREITSLRISITQRCNLECFYCHHEGEQDPGAEMTTGEIERLIRIASGLGMEKLKITGGEPLLRDDICEIISRCDPHMREISLTSNGILLNKKAFDMSEAGLDRVNVSLDTLNRHTYRRISGVDALSGALGGINKAVEAGLNPVKVNMVLMKGLNETEVEDMIEFAEEAGVILQLIELETSRENINNGFYKEYHYDMEELESLLASRANKIESREMHNRMKYFLPGEVEVVRPMHNTSFCANCNRLRITSDGRLKPCLLSADGTVDVLTSLRSGVSDEDIEQSFVKTISAREPYWT